MWFAQVRFYHLMAVVMLCSFAAQADDVWKGTAEHELALALKQAANTGKAKNIILFIGDGMGISTITAARILAGQLDGGDGEDHVLSFERFPYLAMSKTYSANSQTAQSSATMSAMMTGVKTKDDLVSLNDRAIPRRCDTQKGNEAKTFLEMAEEAGLSSGIVSTARITHATPASTYAHTVSRDWENDSEIPQDQKACKDIALQLLEFNYGDGLEVAMGGGRQHFFPQDLTDPEELTEKGKRIDGRNLALEWVKRYSNAAYVWNHAQLADLELKEIDHLLGLFSYSHMAYESDRKKEAAQEPSLSEMTKAAIDILSKNKKGFFLMVEAGRIDHAHHDGNAYRALFETVELSKAVRVAQSNTNEKNTLIIVTADHSHVMTMSGYPIKGNPILGKVVENDKHGKPQKNYALDLNGMPYTTLAYANGPGAATEQATNSEFICCRKPLLDVDTNESEFQQSALVPLKWVTHGGEDVAIYARGPWAHLFHKTHEQHYIFYVMKFAAGFLSKG